MTNEEKLDLLRRVRLGEVDHWTLLEALGVNTGPPPPWASDIAKRLRGLIEGAT